MSETRAQYSGNGSFDQDFRSQIHHSLTYSITTDSIIDVERNKQIRNHSNLVTVDRPDSSQVFNLTKIILIDKKKKIYLK